MSNKKANNVLREQIFRKGFTQNGLAKILRVKQPQISLWLKGVTPRPLMRIKIANALGCTASELFLWDRSVEPKKSICRFDKDRVCIIDFPNDQSCLACAILRIGQILSGSTRNEARN